MKREELSARLVLSHHTKILKSDAAILNLVIIHAIDTCQTCHKYEYRIYELCGSSALLSARSPLRLGRPFMRGKKKPGDTYSIFARPEARSLPQKIQATCPTLTGVRASRSPTPPRSAPPFFYPSPHLLKYLSPA